MTGSMVSSAFSLGEPINTKTPTNTDEDAEKEFEKVVDGIKQTSIQDKEPGSRRPSRPHHSAGETRPEHPLSSTSTTPATSEAVDEPMEEHPLSRCLFCNYDSPTMKLSVLHMSKIHGLFIPEQKYLTDLESLLRYLQTKIHLNNECIYCHKLKTTTSGIQTHMRDKGHCMIAFETSDEMVEIGQFYDFSSTYSDDEEADEDWESEDTEMEGGARMHEGGTADDGWETDSSASSLDSNEVSAVPIDDHSHQYSKLPLHRHHSHSDPRPHKNADGFHSHAHSHSHAAFYSDFELHLPSGRTAGHRSLNRYFRQNLHSYPSEAERQERAQRLLTDAEGDTNMEDSDDRPRDRNGALITRSNAGMLGVTEAQKRVVRAAEKRDKRVEQKERSRYQAKLEKQHNYQKHFRVSFAQFASSVLCDMLS